MALSDRRILEEMAKGDIIIEPFNPKNLATSSYDVTLGEYYFKEKKPNYFLNYYNIYNKKHVDYVWGGKPIKAQLAKEVFAGFSGFEWEGIAPDDKIILIEPGETILAHTNEFIGGKKHITTMMKARSSLGRSFIEVCKCAGWGDVGYVNRWTLEITNNSRHYAIPLVVGRRIGQIVFFETGHILGDDYSKTGKYQTTPSLSEMKKHWSPDQMLPRLYSDRDIKKKK